MQDGLVTSQVSTGGHKSSQLRSLIIVICEEFSLYSDSLLVGLGSFKGEREAVSSISSGIVINCHRLIKTHADNVERAILVKITYGTTVAHSIIIQAPVLGGVFKFHPTEISKDPVMLFERWEMTIALPLGQFTILLFQFLVVILVEIP